jgi:hypothetical protein
MTAPTPLSGLPRSLDNRHLQRTELGTRNSKLEIGDYLNSIFLRPINSG